MNQLHTLKFSEDPVTDFLVGEALVQRVRAHEEKLQKEQEKKREREAFKKFQDGG